MNQESSMSLCLPNIILSTVDGLNQSCGVLVYSGTPVICTTDGCPSTMIITFDLSNPCLISYLE
jgi:hypothetical protein